MSRMHNAVAKARLRARRVGRKATRIARPSVRRHELVGPPELWDVKRRFQFEFLTAHGLQPEHRLLDVGCGVLRGGVPLIEYLQTGHYTGIEARAHVLEEGRKELAKAGLEHKRPQLINASDPAHVELDGHYDFVWAHSVLYHMPDEVAEGYIALVGRCLRGDGAFYANVKPPLGRAGYARGSQPTWQGFPVIGRSREFYARAAAANGLRVENLATMASLGMGAQGGAKEIMLRFTRAEAQPSPAGGG